MPFGKGKPGQNGRALRIRTSATYLLLPPFEASETFWVSSLALSAVLSACFLVSSVTACMDSVAWLATVLAESAA